MGPDAGTLAREAYRSGAVHEHPLRRDDIDEAGEQVRPWTTPGRRWTVDELLAAKDGVRVSVVIPALDEQDTVGAVVAGVHDHLGDGAASDRRLVDELVVLDSGSSDSTASVSRAAGATVVHRDDVLPRIPAVPGKGEAMWRSLAATSGDVVVFLDADLRSFTPDYVVGLLGPVLTRPAVSLVKAVYERPLAVDDVVHAGGGRVTELVARPLLNLYWPELAGVIQPLAGECAARRELLESLPFPTGYGVELAMLVDTFRTHGLDAIAQVDLGVRLHRHHDDRRLGRMSAEILQTAMDRIDPDGGLRGPHVARHGSGTTLTQFDRGPDGFVASVHDVTALERPPMATVPEYALRGSPAAAGRPASGPA
jgi:glucosyl-3-phosphoglycerate synthase